MGGEVDGKPASTDHGYQRFRIGPVQVRALDRSVAAARHPVHLAFHRIQSYGALSGERRPGDEVLHGRTVQVGPADRTAEDLHPVDLSRGQVQGHADRSRSNGHHGLRVRAVPVAASDHATREYVGQYRPIQLALDGIQGDGARKGRPGRDHGLDLRAIQARAIDLAHVRPINPALRAIDRDRAGRPDHGRDDLLPMCAVPIGPLDLSPVGIRPVQLAVAGIQAETVGGHQARGHDVLEARPIQVRPLDLCRQTIDGPIHLPRRSVEREPDWRGSGLHYVLDVRAVQVGPPDAPGERALGPVHLARSNVQHQGTLRARDTDNEVFHLGAVQVGPLDPSRLVIDEARRPVHLSARQVEGHGRLVEQCGAGPDEQLDAAAVQVGPLDLIGVVPIDLAGPGVEREPGRPELAGDEHLDVRAVQPGAADAALLGPVHPASAGVEDRSR